MRFTNIYIPAFAALCVVFLSIPASMIWQQERILKEGVRYRFRLEPVDPADAFRGRYLELNLNVPPFPGTDTTLQYDQKLYVSLGRDQSGLGQFKSLHKTPPTGADYLAVRFGYASEHEVFVLLEDETRRYYLNEKLAPLADKFYAELLARTQPDTSLVTLDLRVLKGKGLIEQVYFEDIPVEEYIRGKGR